MNVHFDLFLQRPFPRMLGAFSSVASVLPLSLGVQGKHSLATWLSSVGSHWIGLWFWVQEVALPSEDSIQLSGAPASLRCCLCPSRLQALPCSHVSPTPGLSSASLQESPGAAHALSLVSGALFVIHLACPAVWEPPCLQTDAKMFIKSQMGPSGSLLPTSGLDLCFSPSRRHSTALARTDGQSGWSSQPCRLCFQLYENLSHKRQSWSPGSQAQRRPLWGPTPNKQDS